MKRTIKTIVVNNVGATFIDIEGNSHTLKQGDLLLPKLLAQAQGPMDRQETVELDFTPIAPQSPVADSYEKFSKSTNGLVKFFRVAKAAIKRFLGAEEDEPKQKAKSRNADEISAMTAAERLKEVMEHAVPLTPQAQADAFKEKELYGSETSEIIALVDEKQIVPNVQRLEKQMTHANETGSVGLKRFYERMATVKRNHQVDELLNFMRRGDLPIAEDGRIIIYKVLTDTKKELEHGCYMVDCHSGTVPQRPGAIVKMDETAVDPSRRHSCSTGLHVARRGYVRNFSGNFITLCKVAPEDVIAVPECEQDKMRVCSYEILYELNAEDVKALRSGRGLETSEGLEYLRRAMLGDHRPATLIVDIGKANKDKPELTLIPIGQPVPDHASITSADLVDPKVDDISHEDEAEYEDDEPYSAPVVPAPVVVAPVILDVEEKPISETMVAVAPTIDPNSLKKAKPKVTTQTKQEQAADLLKDYKDAKGMNEKKLAAASLLSFKQQSKKSWDYLGIGKKDAENVVQLGK